MIRRYGPSSDLLRPAAAYCAIAVLLALMIELAGANGDFPDYRRTAFVSGRDSSAIAAIDIDANALVGRLELGLVPREMLVSQSGGRLIAVDQQSPRIAIVELATRQVRSLVLSLLPTRLRISPDGSTLAAFDDATGKVVLIDLALGRETGQIDGPPGIRDAIFAADGATLFVAADSVDGIAVFDAATARRTTTINGPKIIALVRAPNRREGYALSAGPKRRILHLNLKTPTLLDSQPAPNAEALFPTRTGSHLLLPDPAGGTLSIVPAQPLGSGLTFVAAPGVALAYGAWFDMVAFVPSRALHKLLLYDLDRRKAAGAIALAGTPGVGTVTPDGDKLYLPIEESGEVAVIDANLRRHVATIVVGGSPIQVVIAGGLGICH